MLLRNRKTQEEEKNWCIILSPLSSEIDKKRVTQKIIEVFSLSPEEAADLVSNTPIILLDNLSRPIASKLKDFFKAAGADLLLTNDVFQKRKCYRTVWPEPPNLSFLHGLQVVEEAQEIASSHEVLPADQALHEMRSLGEKPAREEIPTIERKDFAAPSSIERDRLHQETDKWRKECAMLREEAERLRTQIANLSMQEKRGATEHDEDLKRKLQEKEKEARELRVLFGSSEEKYEVLKAEYREARNVYEEKMAMLARESEQWKRKINENTESAQAAEKEKAALQESLVQKDTQYRRLIEERDRAQRSQQEKITQVSQEAEQLKLRIKELQEKITVFERSKEALDQSVNELTEQVLHWRQRYDASREKLDLLEKDRAEEKARFEKIFRDLETGQLKLMADIDAKSEDARQWEHRAMELEKQALELRLRCESHEKNLQSYAGLLESREKELDSARKQLREINLHLEQKETVQRRVQLANQLVEKESLLKKLVVDQERSEAEIREKEDALRKILAEQEVIEKEIMEAKQAQRHLAEQAKKDRFGRVKITKNPLDAEDLGDEFSTGTVE